MRGVFAEHMIDQMICAFDTLAAIRWSARLEVGVYDQSVYSTQGRNLSVEPAHIAQIIVAILQQHL